MGFSATKSSSRSVINEINITPLTDIFLVLLIIMMVVAPMMRQLRGDITPPSVEAGSPVDQDKITVEITSSGEYFIDGTSVASASLASTLTEKHKARESGDMATGSENPASPLPLPGDDESDAQSKVSGMLIIRADKKALSREVLNVFDAARTAGFEKVTIAGESNGSAQSSGNTPNTSALDSWNGGNASSASGSTLFQPAQ